SGPLLPRADTLPACSATRPRRRSPEWGPRGLRPAVGLKPKTPQHAAGILIDPPPSLACAIGTSRAATAAADPPLDPPGVRSSAQGLCVGPNPRGSVVGRVAHS